MKERGVVAGDNSDLYVPGGQQLMQAPPARPLQERVDLVSLLVPPLHLCLVSRLLAERGRSQVARIQVRIADDPDSVDRTDLFMDQVED
jgi:hypothetical protein